MPSKSCELQSAQNVISERRQLEIAMEKSKSNAEQKIEASISNVKKDKISVVSHDSDGEGNDSEDAFAQRPKRACTSRPIQTFSITSLVDHGGRGRGRGGRRGGKTVSRGRGRGRVVPKLPPGLPAAMFCLNIPSALSDAKDLSGEGWKPITALSSKPPVINLRPQIAVKSRGRPSKNQKGGGRPRKGPLSSNAGQSSNEEEEDADDEDVHENTPVKKLVAAKTSKDVLPGKGKRRKLTESSEDALKKGSGPEDATQLPSLPGTTPGAANTPPGPLPPPTLIPHLRNFFDYGRLVEGLVDHRPLRKRNIRPIITKPEGAESSDQQSEDQRESNVCQSAGCKKPKAAGDSLCMAHKQGFLRQQPETSVQHEEQTPSSAAAVPHEQEHQPAVTSEVPEEVPPSNSAVPEETQVVQAAIIEPHNDLFPAENSVDANLLLDEEKRILPQKSLGNQTDVTSQLPIETNIPDTIRQATAQDNLSKSILKTEVIKGLEGSLESCKESQNAVDSISKNIINSSELLSKSADSPASSILAPENNSDAPCGPGTVEEIQKSDVLACSESLKKDEAVHTEPKKDGLEAVIEKEQHKNLENETDLEAEKVLNDDSKDILNNLASPTTGKSRDRSDSKRADAIAKAMASLANSKKKKQEEQKTITVMSTKLSKDPRKRLVQELKAQEAKAASKVPEPQPTPVCAPSPPLQMFPAAPLPENQRSVPELTLPVEHRAYLPKLSADFPRDPRRKHIKSSLKGLHEDETFRETRSEQNWITALKSKISNEPIFMVYRENKKKGIEAVQTEWFQNEQLMASYKAKGMENDWLMNSALLASYKPKGQEFSQGDARNGSMFEYWKQKEDSVFCTYFTDEFGEIIPEEKIPVLPDEFECGYNTYPLSWWGVNEIMETDCRFVIPQAAPPLCSFNEPPSVQQVLETAAAVSSENPSSVVWQTEVKRSEPPVVATASKTPAKHMDMKTYLQQKRASGRQKDRANMFAQRPITTNLEPATHGCKHDSTHSIPSTVNEIGGGHSTDEEYAYFSTVIVSGIPRSFPFEFVKAHFSRFGPIVKFYHDIPKDELLLAKAWIEFQEQSQAKIAIRNFDAQLFTGELQSNFQFKEAPQILFSLTLSKTKKR